MWRCVCQFLHINPGTVDDSAKAAVSLPLAGGPGLRSAERLRHAAHWASWADMLKALSSRVPSVAANFIAALEAGEATPSIQSILSCIDNLAGVGFVVPAWEVVAANSLDDEEEEVDPAQPKHGWQRKATWVVDSAFRRHTIFPALADDQATLLSAQAGPMASAVFIAIPSMKETRIDPQQFRLLFLRRLRLPLPLYARCCRCGRPLDVLGHHRAACANAGFGSSWSKRMLRPESAGNREGVSERNWRCVTWTWVPMSSLMGDAWESSSTDCHLGVDLIWQWTPPWLPSLTRWCCSAGHCNH